MRVVVVLAAAVGRSACTQAVVVTIGTTCVVSPLAALFTVLIKMLLLRVGHRRPRRPYWAFS
jgi:hypothetical protein